MSLSAGSRIGSYEIVSMLGAGGMGEVYRARDWKLKREVAIKVLPDALARDPDRLSRFQREAELLATLNHPNIAAVYGLEESGGSSAIVLELVEGETLAQKIAGLRAKGSGLLLEDALPIARQIVDALEAAHDRGVVHRDLKPANIKITPDGTVKVLDFGLAKMLESDAQASSLSMSPTMSVHATYAGVILGTAAYMSPEQARGKMVDRRTDVWAFGCVLFEMLTGKRTFDPPGDTVSDVVAAVLTQEPDWSALPATTPPHIATLIRRCLQKDPRKRLPHIGVARLEIDEGPALSTLATVGAAAQPLWRRAIPVVMAVFLTAAVAGTAWWRFRPVAAPPTVTRFSIKLPDGQVFTNIGRQVVAISPDGTQLVYVANSRLYLRRLAEADAQPLAATDGSFAVTNPTFSPDGTRVAFYSGGDVSVKRVAIAGGPAVTLGALINPLGMSWGPDGILIGQPGQGIVRVSENGGTPEVIAKLEGGEQAYGPQMLPGGKAMLFTIAKGAGNTADAQWDRARVVIQLFPSGERKTLIQGGSDARYLASGHIIYAVSGVLFAVPFDAERLALTGSPAPVLEGVARSSGSATPATHLSVSANGTLVFVPGPSTIGGGGRQLAIFDRKGAAITALKVPIGNIQHPRVAPDGKRVVFFTEDDKEAIVWTYELSGATAMHRITFGGNNRFPIWSGDGQYIAFQSDREGDAGIFRQRADGGGTAERLTKAASETTHIPESWAPKGEGFLYRETKGGKNILMFYAMKDRTAASFGGVVSGAPTDAGFSPDGRWVVYENGQLDGNRRLVNVQPFPATGATYQVPAVEVGGYRHPLWSPDGREIFYMIGGTVRLMATSVTTQPAFAFGNAVRQAKPASWLDNFNDNARQYDALPDGQHFIARAVAGILTPEGGEGGQTRQIDVVLNWFEELKQRAPLPR